MTYSMSTTELIGCWRDAITMDVIRMNVTSESIRHTHYEIKCFQKHFHFTTSSDFNMGGVNVPGGGGGGSLCE